MVLPWCCRQRLRSRETRRNGESMSAMLHDFILANSEQIIDRARVRGRDRATGKSSQAKLEHGIPLFLSQLADQLVPTGSTNLVQIASSADASNITDSAALRGHHLLKDGFTVAQVVHGYGDVCQVVTDLASETKAPISRAEFHVFDRCIDEAIAGAVGAYGRQRERDFAHVGAERLGVLARELRNVLNSAILSFDVIKKGMVGLGGRAGAEHSRSLSGLRALIERSLAEVRLEAGTRMPERFSAAEFFEEIEARATMQAEGHGLQLTVNSEGGDIVIAADWQLLALAVSNLLHNAFKFTRAHGHVSLTTRATTDCIVISVGDECGGLPCGKAEELSGSFSPGAAERLGLGLGLSIALNAVRVNSGDLYVRDIPGKGCVFTIDLPRQPPPSTAIP
jgi:signal transduction histidine kinase